MPNPTSILFDNLALGLNTKLAPSEIAPGYAQAGSKNFFVRDKKLTSAKGYTKLTKTLPQDYAYKLNGLDQYMVGKISGTGSLVSAAHAALTLQVTVTLNAIPQDFNPNGGGFYWGFAAYRGTGVTKDASFSVGNTRYAIGVSVDTTTTVKTLRAMFIGSDGLTIWTWPHSVALELGKSYILTATFSAANNWTYYVAEVGGSAFADSPGGAHSTTAYADISGGMIAFGGVPCTTSSFGKFEDQSQYNFPGVVQDFRVWDRELDVNEIDAINSAQIEDPSSETDLISYYHLTGAATNTYWLAPTKGTAGSGSGEAPYVSLMPREATWRTTGHVLGNPMSDGASLDFDGRTQGLVVPDAYRYRKQQPNDNGEYPFPKTFCFSTQVNPRTLVDRETIFYYGHVPNDRKWETVTSEVLSVTGANVSDTLLRAPAIAGSMTFTVVTSASGTLTFSDNGVGGLTQTSGAAATITTGTVSYTTGAISIDLLGAAFDITSATVTYNSYVSHLLTQTTATGTFATLDHGNVLLEILDTGAGAYRFRAVVWHEQDVTAEALTITANDVADTLLLPAAVPGTVIATVTKSAGGDVVLQDDGAGNFTITSGTGTITSASINYLTGAISINLVQNLASGTVDYRSRRATSCISANNLSAAASHHVTLQTNWSDPTTGGVLSLCVDTAATVTQTATANGYVPNSANFIYPIDPGPSRKYVMVMGRAVRTMQQVHTLPDRPEDVNIDYAFNRSFDGELNRVFVVGTEQEFDVRQLHDFAVNNESTRTNSQTLGLPISSHWPMLEGAGPNLEDVGLQANPIVFQEDPGHVWGRSSLTTIAKQPFLGVFDHRYRSATGEVRKIIGIAGGSVYEIDPSDGSYDFLSDGFRNDFGNLVSTEKFIDSTILCCDGRYSGPFHLWKDQLYKLSIDKPKGTIAYGLNKQGSSEGGLRKSDEPYRYLFTFWSRHQNKRSDIQFGPEITIRHRRADVIFGTDCEMNQTYPSSGISANADPFDCSEEFTKVGYSSWYGRTTTLSAGDPDWYQTQPGTSGANTRPAPLKVINFEKFSIIAENDEVTAEEVQTAFDLKNKRTFVRIKGDDRIEILGGFPGALGRLWLQDDMSSVATVSDGGIFDFNATTTGSVYTGTGVTGHGIALPFSTDPQVTHLEIWRTVAGGNQFFLVDRVENGTKTFTDSVRDEDLGGRDVLDINRGPAPRAKFVREFAGRYFFWGDDLAPSRLYESSLNEPWNNPPQNTVDVLKGSTQKIIACEATENAMCVFKNDITHVVTETGDTSFPFRMSPRLPDVGCVSPRGVAFRRGTFAFPNEQGIFGYDLNTVTDPPLSDPISPTWQEINPDYYEQIVAVRDWRNESTIWFYASGDQTVNGSVVNDRALVFFDDGGWSLLDGLFVKYATVIPNGQETNEIWIIDPMGYISIWDQGTNYGVGTLTPRTVSVSRWLSTTTVEVPQATLAALPEGYKGLPVVMVDASGNRYTRYVVDDNLAAPNSVITLNMAVTGPPLDGTANFGSIEFDWIGGDHSLPDRVKQSQVVEVYGQWIAQDTAATFEFLLRSAGGHNPTATIVESSISTLSNQEPAQRWGIAEMSSRSAIGRHHRPRIRALGPDKPVTVRSFTLGLNPHQLADGYNGPEV